MRMVDIIYKKREKQHLTDEEIQFFIDGYINNEIPDYQVSALLMAILLNGMNQNEIVNLTKIMMNSGRVLDLSDINGIKLDKHSTGGIGDKVSLVLGPIIAACGGKVAKMSGRGLGHTGGTIDKLESIEGFNCFLDEKEFKKLVNKSNIAIIGQTDDLVPADKKIYALRDVTATTESFPLIVSSIMSKKLATGSDAILIDIKCGSGAFIKTIEQAHELAKHMIYIGKELGRDIKIEISNMEQPLGRMIGNKNEVIEAMQSLQGNGEKQFMELIYSSGSTMLKQAKLVENNQEAKKLIEEVIKTKKAFNKFLEMIKNQGGNAEIIQQNNWWNPKYCEAIIADKSGYVLLHNSIELGLAAMKLGAGRERKEDLLDYEAGIEIVKTSNEWVDKGDEIMKLYSSKPIDPSIKKTIVDKSISIENKPSNIKIILEQME